VITSAAAADSAPTPAGDRRARVRLGLAGLGRIGRLHAANLGGRLPSVELAAVVDSVEEVARGLGERLGVRWSLSFEDLLADPEIEGVVVATSTPEHAWMVERAAAAGKHVFCEKPIALELEPARRAVAAARAAGVKLQVGFHRRFDPDWAAAASRIRSGELGEVYLFRTSLRDMQPPAVGYLSGSGGLFADTTVHDLDTARWLIGEIDEITAVGAALTDPAIAEAGDVDTAVVTLRFAGGALGVIDNSRAAGYGYECSSEVVGSKATARIGYHRQVNVTWLTPGNATVDWVSDFTERFADAYRLELEAFAAAIRQDRPPPVTGEDALAAFTLAEACALSLREACSVRLRHRATEDGVVYDPSMSV
jgi:myo-inositol 2-dehydrogenase / D-chiro-inositol 1-dehydrogenase